MFRLSKMKRYPVFVLKSFLGLEVENLKEYKPKLFFVGQSLLKLTYEIFNFFAAANNSCRYV